MEGDQAEKRIAKYVPSKSIDQETGKSPLCLNSSNIAF